MANTTNNPSIWVRLKRIIRMIKSGVLTRGDGGAYTDKYLPITKPKIDTTKVIKDTVVTTPRTNF